MNRNDTESHIFTVFGGTGDLMGRKLLPALYHLRRRKLLGSNVQVLAVARDRTMTDKSYRNWAIKQVANSGIERDKWLGEWCSSALHYQSIVSGDASSYNDLSQRMEQLEDDQGLAGNRLFYLALPPAGLPTTVTGLSEVGLNRSRGWTRLVLEKPFGRDLSSAVELNKLLHQHFDESQIFRIDHYLGKETVQNLLVFRFANPIFESVWNRDRIESIDILVAEELGVGTRAGYYDRSGALRDMVQNHLTQLLCLTAMEIPTALDGNAIRDEKVKVLRSIPELEPSEAIFGQYARSEDDHGAMPGYREEPGIDPNSTTETYVALKVNIANWRWQGVPFRLRTGKRLAGRRTTITVRFRRPPVALFQRHGLCRLSSNELVITLQPSEGFDLNFEVKSPEDEINMETQSLRFRYAEAFGKLPEAYETLLLDVIDGDQTLFVRSDEAEAAWRLYTPLLAGRHELHFYAPGTWGPNATAGNCPGHRHL